MMKFALVLFFVLTASVATESYEILLATPLTIKSLHGLFASIAKYLADAGHKVTFLSSYDLQTKHANIEFVYFPEIDKLNNQYSVFEMRRFDSLGSTFGSVITQCTHEFWSDPRAMAIWRRRDSYDLFITSSIWMEFLFPFLMGTDVPFVQICTPGIEPMSLAKDGNWLVPSVTPGLMMNYDEYMTFWERVLNLPAYFIGNQMFSTAFPAVVVATQKYFPEFKDPQSYNKRLALTLINGHFALDGPYPLLPNQIEIGTINAKFPQPLPQDLESYVQSSGDAGIIYFSLGSIAKATEMPQEAKLLFLEAFSKLPQKVIWKYEGTDVKLPSNVITKKWLPQQDILGHPMTRLFISHCGNLGTQEAKYHGVPVLAVPIAFDQPRNAARMARKGYALVLQWEELSVHSIVQAINTLINDTSYKERLTVVSQILHDQKETPAERAVWWLEYVIRHKGAPHLQYSGKSLSLFQYAMLDVISFWLAAISAFVFVIIRIIKFLCCSRGKKENIRKKMKKH